MEGTDQVRELIREYLLGNLDGEQREQVEIRVLTDPLFKEQVLVVEDELAEEYVDGELNEAERERFIRRFLQPPGLRKQVEITRALKEYAAAQSGSASLAARLPGGFRLPARLGNWLAVLRRFPKTFLAAGLAALLVAVLLVWTFDGAWQRQSRRAALEGELVRLNNRQGSRPGAERYDPPAVEKSLLPARLLRSGAAHQDALPVVESPDGARLIRFRLALLDGAYRSYRIVIKKGDDVMAAFDLGAGGEGQERAVVVDVPAQQLGDGDYVIELLGRDDAGRQEAVDDYPFRLVNR